MADYVIQGNYGYGWEDVTIESTREDADQMLGDYDHNEPQFPHRVVVRNEGVFKYIMYLHTSMPGDVSVTLRRVKSLQEAKDELREFERNSGFHDECTASLYAYSEEDWAEAEEYATIGNPFDYPWKVIERGPRGGMRVVNA